MTKQTDLAEMDNKIQTMKKAALDLKGMADQFPAVSRNVSRVLSSIKMLELNVSDILDLK
jgi:hypothetical protein